MIAAWLVTGQPFVRTPINGALPLLIMVLVSLYATYDVAVSLPRIAGLVLGVGIFDELVVAQLLGSSRHEPTQRPAFAALQRVPAFPYGRPGPPGGLRRVVCAVVGNDKDGRGVVVRAAG